MNATLTRAFVARFFENDLTAGGGDLRQSFFWMLALLAPIGIAWPWLMSFSVAVIEVHHGPAVLREWAMADKVMYLGFTMVVAGALSVISWGALSIERRDVLVLGVLPIRGRSIILAKLAALAVYTGLVMAVMHAGASVFFGLLLGTGETAAFSVRGIAAHFIASCLAGAFVVFGITAVRSIALVILGPRLFERASPVLQFVVSTMVLMMFMALPTVSSAIVGAIAEKPGAAAWVLNVPSVWFLGAYESVLGTDKPVLIALTTKALLATVLVIAVTSLLYPMVYRRVMRAVDEMPTRARVSWITRVFAVIEILAARAARLRGVIQFMLATVTRVERHRLTLAVAAGATIALLLPVLLGVLRNSGVVLASPPPTVLSAPFTIVLFSVIGFRIAAALPGDRRAGWMFAAVGVPRETGRNGLRRLMILFGVLPATAVFGTYLWLNWGSAWGVTHGAMCLASGVFLVEFVLRNYSGVPCSGAWRLEGANLRSWWPAYLSAFVVFTQAVPRSSYLLVGRTIELATVVLILIGCALAMMLRPAPVADDFEVETGAPAVLDLSS